MNKDHLIQQINKTQEGNLRLLRLFSLYINERADFISADMVREVAQIGGFGTEEAFLILFSEACGVHPTDDGEDAAFFRDFLAPCISRLDAAKYRNDPYYRNIRFPDVKDGEWEFRNDCFQPYQAFIWDDVPSDGTMKELPPLGYFEETFTYPAVLEKGREWMLVTPNEVETIRPAIAAARGRVVTFGLGLGYFPYMASEKDDVEQVTVVEKDPAVIRLFERYILPQFGKKEKITLINADAFDYLDRGMPGGHFEYAYADIWHDTGDGVPLYLRFNKYEKRFPDTKFDYWIERTMLNDIRRYDLDHMPEDVHDPYLWLNDRNTKQRAKALTPEAWQLWIDPEP